MEITFSRTCITKLWGNSLNTRNKETVFNFSPDIKATGDNGSKLESVALNMTLAPTSVLMGLK
jgi:hypothetical protein